MSNDAALKVQGHNSVRVEIVTNYEQMLHAYAIRSICFMEEHGVKARQTFDGNDYQATHVIVYADDEPVGTARIRWFKEFAKLERLSLRKAYRTKSILKSCCLVAIEHIARKGFDKIITHAKPEYARLWQILLGFKQVEGKAPIFFAGHDEPYLELVKVLKIPENAIGLDTDPTILFRIEGQWDKSSPFEVV